MEKVLLVPDSFKGTMSSIDFCEIAKEAIVRHHPDAAVICVPVADGGEGSVDSFLASVGGEKKIIPVKGPYMEEMDGFYGLIDGGSTAVIEMAACAGLPLVGDRLRPGKTTTFGVGQLMESAVKNGCRRIIMGLGGSATNDFGTGAAAALGVRFFDDLGDEFVPVGETLSRISRIDKSGLLPGLGDIEITSMCDIDNPLFGTSGAAYVFGPQKGADRAMVEFLDGQLRSVSETVRRELNLDVSAIPGAGAAGGMGGGMVAFFNSRLQLGIEVVLDAVGFDEMLEGTDIVISGEGSIDSQSLRGKVVIGVARRAKKHGVPLIAIVGDIGDDIEKAYEEGVSAVFSINRVALPFSEARLRSKKDLSATVDNLLKFMSSMAQSAKRERG
ncbi:MAG: glycerate kinase [Synergistaceae bacterium]|jgi:glycerate kinase|nr:glycerate kinase [Synergistaceae bacterium]